MDIEAKGLIDSISKISDSVSKNLKPLIQKLARNIDKNLETQEIKNIGKEMGVEKLEKKNVARILFRLRNKYNWVFSEQRLYEHIQPEYKTNRVSDKEAEKPVRLTDNYLSEHFAEVESKLKDFKKRITPAKEIISKARIEDMERYTWKCHVAEELAWIAIKMENEHENHDDKLCKEYAKRAKMVRDSRFATDANSYEAIILACNTTQSLKNAIVGEWEFKTRWEIEHDEKKCRESNKGECLGELQCKDTKCTHECHRVIRPMTTKGLKYAIKTNEDLHNLDKQIKRLATIDNDICRIGKMLLENPKTKKLLGVTEIKKLIYSHVEKDDCLQCDIFLEKNTDFFNTFK